jgi:hypothetical protein
VTRNARELTQRGTSTISSEIGGGIGSEWIYKLFEIGGDHLTTSAGRMTGRREVE